MALEVVNTGKFRKEFSVSDILGKGERGCVFDAHNRFDGGQYAVKRLEINIDAETWAEYAMREVHALCKLEHPGIVRYYGAWVEQPPEGAQAVEDEKMLKHIDGWRGRIMRYNSDSGFIYIQMQRCDYSLENWLERNKDQNSRSLPLMKSWFKQVVSAVKHIHKMNLIHRDLKPANILFVKDSILKVCDLGFSAETNEKDIAIDRTCGGSDLYASPEQTGQHDALDCDNTRPKYNSKTDVFSLGMIFAEMCVAMTDEDHRLAVFKDLRRGRRSASIQDETVADFIAKLTKDKPDDRPTCAEILEDSFFM